MARIVANRARRISVVLLVLVGSWWSAASFFWVCPTHRCVIPNAPQLAALARPAEVNERIIRFLRGTACTTRSEAA